MIDDDVESSMKYIRSRRYEEERRGDRRSYNGIDEREEEEKEEEKE